MPETYPGTDVLLKKYLAIKDKIHTKQNIVLEFWSDYYEIILRTKSVWGQSRVLNGLPDKEEQISHIMENGGSSQQHYNRSFRDVSWLEENGTSLLVTSEVLKMAYLQSPPTLIPACRRIRAMHGQYKGWE